MRKLLFYPRLAAKSIRSNAKYYLPYFLTCAGAAAMFYIMFFLSANKGLSEMRGAMYVLSMLWLGSGVVAIFSAVTIFYTNSFLMKRRRRELGLYRVLGMEKRHIARVLFWETVYTALVGVLGGLAVGVLLSKLMLLLLCAILRVAVPFGFFVSTQGLIWTAGVFCVIFVLCLLSNLRRVGRMKPIELLHSDAVGEREPKSRWLLVVLGVLTLGAGYGIAVAVQNPLSALFLFFIAVLLVIAGTFCLFAAGSIAVLKLLRRKKGFYYRTRNFIAVSGMLHRMKRNAAGLATICILCTMVLVTISTTVSLYTGMDEVLGMMYPREVQVFLFESDEESMREAAVRFEQAARESGTEIENLAFACYYPDEGAMGSKQYVGKVLSDYLEQYQSTGVINYNGQDYPPTVYVGCNVAGSAGSDFEPAPQEFVDALERIVFDSGLTFETGYVDLRETAAGEIYGMLGGFFFMGLLLGFLFLMATVLIIYYKQVSEGYEDARGYQIMQQVGLSQQEVRQSIRRQVMTVFFLPLAGAAVHVCFAFNMMARMLSIFSLSNVSLFAWCCLGTFLVFAVIYAAIYSLTAKAYYRIVRV